MKVLFFVCCLLFVTASTIGQSIWGNVLDDSSFVVYHQNQLWLASPKQSIPAPPFLADLSFVPTQNIAKRLWLVANGQADYLIQTEKVKLYFEWTIKFKTYQLKWGFVKGNWTAKPIIQTGSNLWLNLFVLFLFIILTRLTLKYYYQNKKKIQKYNPQEVHFKELIYIWLLMAGVVIINMIIVN